MLGKKAHHVVVGGLGNLGKHLQRALLENGHAVRVLDRPTASSKGLLSHAAVEFLPYTLGKDDPAKLLTALEGAETVYSVVTPDVQHGTVGEFLQTNHRGMQHLVQACKQVGVPKLVYASSIAVTNHSIPSCNQTEEAPLPPMESYVSSYDRTKRLGEDVLLEANNSNSFRTCALRLGGILASPNDYMLRQHFETGGKSGRIYTVQCEPIDTIAASDVARAMVKADEKLESGEDLLCGRAINVTKCREGVAPRANEMAQFLGDSLGWQVRYVPKPVLSVMQTGMWLRHALAAPFQKDDDRPGMPPHVYLDLTNYEQTFDNSLARKVLGFEPKLTWKQAVESIVNEYAEIKSRKVKSAGL